MHCNGLNNFCQSKYEWSELQSAGKGKISAREEKYRCERKDIGARGKVSAPEQKYPPNEKENLPACGKIASREHCNIKKQFALFSELLFPNSIFSSWLHAAFLHRKILPRLFRTLTEDRNLSHVFVRSVLPFDILLLKFRLPLHP